MGSYELGSLWRYISAQPSFSSYTAAPTLQRQDWFGKDPTRVHFKSSEDRDATVPKITVDFETVKEESSQPKVRQCHGFRIPGTESYETFIRSILGKVASAHKLRHFRSQSAYPLPWDQLTPLLYVIYCPYIVMNEIIDDIKNWIARKCNKRTGINIDPSRLVNT